MSSPQPANSIEASVRHRQIRAALFVVMAVELTMAVGKGVYGTVTGSLGMISDGFHSALHALGILVGLVRITLASRPPDPRHPYGYERFEPLSALAIVAFMLIAVWRILTNAWTRLHAVEVPQTGVGSFVLMAGAILLTLLLATWERSRADALQSSLLRGNAARYRADLLVSSTVVGGLLFARFGFPQVDTAVSLMVTAAIGRSAWRIGREASQVLADASGLDLEQIAGIAQSVPGVVGYHRVRARGISGKARVDLHVMVAPELSVARSHEIAHEVERQVRERIEGIAEVIVHVGPPHAHATNDWSQVRLR